MRHFFYSDKLVFKIARQIFFYGSLLALWKFIVWLRWWPQYVVPSPERIGEAFVEGFENGSLSAYAGQSLWRSLSGFIAALFFAVPAGLVIGKIRALRETAGSFLKLLNTLPAVCWLPVAAVWFGPGKEALFFAVFAAAFFTVTISLWEGVRNVDSTYVKTARNLGARGRKLFFRVTLPASLPYHVRGLRTGWAAAWQVLVAGELLLAGLGMGHFLNTGRQINDMSQVAAGVLVIFGITFFIDRMCLAAIERKVLVLWPISS